MDPAADFERDGEWYNIDIPMSYLEDQYGLSFAKAKDFTGNILSILAGGTEGTVLDYDAVFFYGPKTSTGVAGATAEKAYYTLSGSKVSVDFAKANKGVYVVKEGDSAKKVVVE